MTLGPCPLHTAAPDVTRHLIARIGNSNGLHQRAGLVTRRCFVNGNFKTHMFLVFALNINFFCLVRELSSARRLLPLRNRHIIKGKRQGSSVGPCHHLTAGIDALGEERVGVGVVEVLCSRQRADKVVA